MKAIQTTYHGPTNANGSRISASDTDGNRVTIPYPHEYSGAKCHAQAALALCRKMGWGGTLIAGGLKDHFVFVFAEGERFDVGLTPDEIKAIHDKRFPTV